MVNTKKKTYQMDLCTGPILGKLLRFSLPLMLSSVLQLLFNAADVAVVGRFAGNNSLAAVGSTGSLVNLVVNLFVGLSIGANVLSARFFGAKEEQQLEKTVHTSMLLALGSGLAMCLLGVGLAPTILRWMKSPPEVLGLSVLYLRIYFLGMPAMMTYNFGSAILRAVGDTRRPMYYLMLSGVVNVVLNLFFVIVLRLDVAGVAIATTVSQCISAALVVRCLLREQGALRLELRKLKLHRDIVLEILRIGLPASLQGIVFSLSNMVIQSAVNGFGATVIAGNSAASNLEGFVAAAMNAFYQAAISFTSQNFGAKAFRRILRILLWCLVSVFVVGFVLGNACVLFGRQLLGIYTTSPEVIAAGQTRLGVIAKTYYLWGITDVMVGMLRGIGYSVAPMIVSVVGVCGLRLLWLATVFRMEQYHTIRVVYLSYPISWIVTFTAHTICFLWAYRRVLRRHRETLN